MSCSTCEAIPRKRIFGARKAAGLKKQLLAIVSPLPFTIPTSTVPCLNPTPIEYGMNAAEAAVTVGSNAAGDVRVRGRGGGGATAPIAPDNISNPFLIHKSQIRSAHRLARFQIEDQ